MRWGLGVKLCGWGDLCEENRRIQALNRLLDALRAMIGRLSDQAQGILTAVKRRQRPSGAPQAPSSPEPAERPQERPQARETPPQAPQEPPKPIRTKKALTDRFKTRLDERLAENERKQAENRPNPTWRRHGTSPTPPTRSTSAWAGAREATDSACENAGNAKGRHPKTPARNLERHPYQRVTDTPSTPEPSAVAMRIHGPAATGVYVTPLIAKVICPDLLPVV